MSDNKQSSVDWLLQELTYDNGFGQRCISFIETVDLTPYFEQAKAKHKDEIETAYWEGGQDVPMTSKRCEEYYNEIYGGKNE